MLYRSQFEMSAAKRLFQLNYIVAAGRRKMPKAYRIGTTF
jgi:hypothetical protein